MDVLRVAHLISSSDEQMEKRDDGSFKLTSCELIMHHLVRIYSHAPHSIPKQANSTMPHTFHTCSYDPLSTSKSVGWAGAQCGIEVGSSFAVEVSAPLAGVSALR